MQSNEQFLAKAEAHMNDFEGLYIARGSSSYISTTPEFNMADYQAARPGDTIATNINQIMYQCEQAYHLSSITRSIIEMIADFVVDGLEIIDIKDDRANNFYKTWLKKTELLDKANQGARHCLKSGNFVVQRFLGKATVVNKSEAVQNSIPTPRTGMVPVRYQFYRPSDIELVGGEAGALSSKKIYGLRINHSSWLRYKQGNTEFEKEVINSLPPEVKESLDKNISQFLYPLPADKIFVGHYKKDDHEIWAYPLIYPILQDIQYNVKLQQARISSMNEWCSKLELWQLGDHKEGLLPSKAQAQKLANILNNNVGGGTKTIIWDSMIKYEQFYPPIEQLKDFIPEKSSILLNFGVPEEVAGGVLDKSGGSDSILRLKNMIKKIETCRNAIQSWIEAEISIVRKAMGFKNTPIVRFAYTDLYDDQVIFTLMRELLDRNIISNETMLERMKEIPEVERLRILKQEKQIKSEELPPKAGPFYKPDLQAMQDFELTKIKEMSKNKSDTPPGRPNGVPDSTPRKRAPNRNKSRASLLIFARQAFDHIENTITEAYLGKNGIKDYRSLGSEQKDSLFEMIKVVFANIEPHAELTDKMVIQTAQNIDQSKSDRFFASYADLLNEAPNNLRLSDLKLMLLESYVSTHSESV